MDSRLFIKIRKYLIIISFSTIFLGTLIINIPAWVLNSQLTKYTNHQLALYNLSGSFWKGSGLLVASSKKVQEGQAPLAHIQWKVSLGFTKFINVSLSQDQHKIAEIYLNKNGLNIDKLDLSLSIVQVSYLSDVVKDLNISGNCQINAEHLLLAKKPNGTVRINVRNVSSGMSPVNPLGSYSVTFNTENNKIDVSTQGGAILNLDGEGSINSLILKASIAPEKVESMKTFITLLGIPNADGTYNIKLF
jgi:hypothetical protein